MKRTIGAVVTLIVVGSLAISNPALARFRGPGPQSGGSLGRLLSCHSEELDIDAATAEALRDVVEDAELELEELRLSARKAHRALERLVRMEAPDREQIDAQLMSVAEAEQALRAAETHLVLDVRARLTPEQWRAVECARHREGARQRRPLDREDGSERSPRP